MPGLWFEDFTPGRVIDAEWTRTVTEADNVMFCGMTMNVARLHLDAEYMKSTEFGRPIVNSLFTLGLMIETSPSGSPQIARTCCSNCEVRAPSIVQWPELCTRGATSLTIRRSAPS